MFGKPRRRSRPEQMEPVNLTHSPISRRHFLQVLGFLATNTVLASEEGIQASGAGAHENNSVEYGKNTLPLGVRSRRVDTNNGVVRSAAEHGRQSRQPTTGSRYRKGTGCPATASETLRLVLRYAGCE
jgi:hypothetical protein